jgi:hypothetical protein
MRFIPDLSSNAVSSALKDRQLSSTELWARCRGLFRAGLRRTLQAFPCWQADQNFMKEMQLALERWASFYLTMSAAAATLIGLLFVVIALVAGGGGNVKQAAEGAAKIRVYLTPTVVYFASVLFVAAILTFPNHTRLTAVLCICIAGIVGLLYSGSTLVGGDKRSYYRRLDLIPYAGLPFLAYGLLVWGGALLLHDTQRGLTFAAIGMLLLLAIGIRNSWAIAIAIVFSTRPGHL